MRPALPAYLLYADQPKINFMDKGGRLQRVRGALTPHIAVRCAMQVLVHQFGKPLERRLISPVPSPEQARDFSRGLTFHTALLNSSSYVDQVNNRRKRNISALGCSLGPGFPPYSL